MPVVGHAPTIFSAVVVVQTSMVDRRCSAQRAQVVVIGGGITGCSVAYHLAEAGWRDVLLLEKGELTSGSTCHAAGLVTQFNPSPTMMRFRRYSVELYTELGVFEPVGSLRIASSPESLRRAAARRQPRPRRSAWTSSCSAPDEALELMPAAIARVAVRRRLDGRATATSIRTSRPTRSPTPPATLGVRDPHRTRA